jgi:YspA, cpYpsA-related SLOG family
MTDLFRGNRIISLVVTGGRNYSDWRYAWACLDYLHRERGPIEHLAHGSAKPDKGVEWSADLIAHAWGEKMPGVRVWRYPALWGKVDHPHVMLRYTKRGEAYDAAAGPRRNRLMLEQRRPQVLLAFEGGRGTAGCIAQAIAQGGIEIIRAKELQSCLNIASPSSHS